MKTPKNLTSHLLDRLEGQLLTGKLSRRCFIQASVALGASVAASSALADTLDDARANQDMRVADLPAEFDMIVCGGGT